MKHRTRMGLPAGFPDVHQERSRGHWAVMGLPLAVERDELVLQDFGLGIDRGGAPSDGMRRETRHLMSRWRLVQVIEAEGARKRYLLGQAEGQCRVCLNVRGIDVRAMTVTLRSGRVYQLEGASRYDFDADFLLAYWLRLHGLGPCRDLSRALLRLKARYAHGSGEAGRGTVLASCPVTAAAAVQTSLF